MDIPDQSVITVLTYLLPGFITAALVYSLTPSPRPIPFERVVQALIFTMLSAPNDWNSYAFSITALRFMWRRLPMTQWEWIQKRTSSGSRKS